MTSGASWLGDCPVDGAVFGFFTVPYRDELIYSAIARLRQELSDTPSLTIIREAFGAGARGVSPCLPGNLSRLASVIPGEGFTVDNLIWRGTTWPYHAWLSEASQRLAVEAGLRSGWAAATVRPSPSRGALHHHDRLNFCTACAAEDRAGGREPGWRRVHQLPGVFVCPWHGSSLRRSRVSSFHSSHLVCCPHDGAGSDELSCPLAACLARRLARESLWLLENRRPAFPQGGIQSTVRNILGEQGLLGTNGMAVGTLWQAVVDYHGRKCMEALGLARPAGSGRTDPHRLWGRAPRLRTGMLGLLLLLDFLETPFLQFASMVREPPELRERAASVQIVTCRSSCRDRHRRIVVRLVADKPLTRRSELKRLARVSYLYLQRNDCAWFEAILPPKVVERGPGPNWGVRDAELARAVTTAASVLLDRRPQVRLTRALLAEAVGQRTLLMRGDPRLPKCYESLSAATESRETFRLRRLRTTALEGAREHHGWSGFAQAAAFRDSEFPSLGQEARRIWAAGV